MVQNGCKPGHTMALGFKTELVMMFLMRKKRGPSRFFDGKVPEQLVKQHHESQFSEIDRLVRRSFSLRLAAPPRVILNLVSVQIRVVNPPPLSKNRMLTRGGFRPPNPRFERKSGFFSVVLPLEIAIWGSQKPDFFAACGGQKSVFFP